MVLTAADGVGIAAVASRYGAAGGRTVVEHGQPDLVQHQQFLRQLMTNGQLGQPVDDRVDFGGVDPADLLSTGQSVRDAPIGELRAQASPVAARVTVAGRGINSRASDPQALKVDRHPWRDLPRANTAGPASGDVVHPLGSCRPDPGGESRPSGIDGQQIAVFRLRSGCRVYGARYPGATLYRHIDFAAARDQG